MAQLELANAIRLASDDQGKVRLIVRRDFYEFMVSAQATDAPEHEGYVALESHNVNLKERPRESTEYVLADSPGVRLSVARFGDDPPCGDTWQ